MSTLRSVPSLAHEHALWSEGCCLIAGVDEVGRGCLAGPVVAAAVILPLGSTHCIEDLEGVTDSKQLSPEERRLAFLRIRRVAHRIGIGWSSHHVIDRLGIAPANRRAMTRAVKALGVCPDALLVDYESLPHIPLPQRSIVRGDAESLSIAAASVVAKVMRDRWMEHADTRYPLYAFAANKGYGTEHHRRALQLYGPCSIHRRSFRPVQCCE